MGGDELMKDKPDVPEKDGPRLVPGRQKELCLCDRGPHDGAAGKADGSHSRCVVVEGLHDVQRALGHNGNTLLARIGNQAVAPVH